MDVVYSCSVCNTTDPNGARYCRILAERQPTTDEVMKQFGIKNGQAEIRSVRWDKRFFVENKDDRQNRQIYEAVIKTDKCGNCPWIERGLVNDFWETGREDAEFWLDEDARHQGPRVILPPDTSDILPVFYNKGMFHFGVSDELKEALRKAPISINPDNEFAVNADCVSFDLGRFRKVSIKIGDVTITVCTRPDDRRVVYFDSWIDGAISSLYEAKKELRRPKMNNELQLGCTPYTKNIF